VRHACSETLISSILYFVVSAMSATTLNGAVEYGADTPTIKKSDAVTTKKPDTSTPGASNYKGFVAGVFSGIAKLSGK